MTVDGLVRCGTTIAAVRAEPRDSAVARWLGRYPSRSMACSTVALVDSRTLADRLMTRETVPTPKPDAAATSAIVTGREPDISLPRCAPVPWKRFHGGLEP